MFSSGTVGDDVLAGNGKAVKHSMCAVRLDAGLQACCSIVASEGFGWNLLPQPKVLCMLADESIDNLRSVPFYFAASIYIVFESVSNVQAASLHATLLQHSLSLSTHFAKPSTSGKQVCLHVKEAYLGYCTALTMSPLPSRRTTLPPLLLKGKLVSRSPPAWLLPTVPPVV